MMEAAFITTEDGDDMIVSFAITDPDGDVLSLTLLRTPKYEFVFDDFERGVNVSYEDSDDDEGDLLEEFEIRGDAVRIATARQSYDVDIHRVGADEVEEAKRILDKMNFDGRFKLKFA